MLLIWNGDTTTATTTRTITTTTITTTVTTTTTTTTYYDEVPEVDCKGAHALVELNQVQIEKIVCLVCHGGIKLAFLQVNTPDIYDFLCLALALHMQQYLRVRQ